MSGLLVQHALMSQRESTLMLNAFLLPIKPEWRFFLIHDRVGLDRSKLSAAHRRLPNSVQPPSTGHVIARLPRAAGGSSATLRPHRIERNGDPSLLRSRKTPPTREKQHRQVEAPRGSQDSRQPRDHRWSEPSNTCFASHLPAASSAVDAWKAAAVGYALERCICLVEG